MRELSGAPHSWLPAQPAASFGCLGQEGAAASKSNLQYVYPCSGRRHMAWECESSPTSQAGSAASEQGRVLNEERNGMQEKKGQWIKKLYKSDCHGSCS